MRDGLFDLIFMFLPKFYGFFFWVFENKLKLVPLELFELLFMGFGKFSHNFKWLTYIEQKTNSKMIL